VVHVLKARNTSLFCANALGEFRLRETPLFAENLDLRRNPGIEKALRVSVAILTISQSFAKLAMKIAHNVSCSNPKAMCCGFFGHL